MCMKLFLFGIAVSSILINAGCDRTDIGGEPPPTYLVYINETTTGVIVKSYKFIPPETMEILLKTIESNDSLIMRSSSVGLTATDSVDIIFNNRKMLRYRRNNVNSEKWSIYNIQDYELFGTKEYGLDIYRITDQHKELAKDIDE